MNLKTYPPIGLLAPIITTIERVKVCESGVYPDKFGQIHSHQLIQWAANYKTYSPILLEHQPFTGSFFGYVYKIYAEGEALFADLALTQYGLQALYDYKEKYMGCGWSLGISQGKTNINEITLCRVPRVSTTHVVTIDNTLFNKIVLKERTQNDLLDHIVSITRAIVDSEVVNNQTRLIEEMKQLQEFIYCNNLEIPDLCPSSEEQK